MRSVALILAGLAVMGTLPPSPAGSAPGRRAGIAEVLERRHRAVLARDRGAFLATVSRDADTGFKEAQMRSFAGLAGVPLASYSLTPRWARSGDLARPSDRERYPGAEDVAIVLVEERYRIEGIDGAPAAEDHYLTFVKSGGEWGVAANDDLEDVGLLGARHLWDGGPVDVERRGAFLVLEHPCSSEPCSSVADDVAAALESAADEVESLLPFRWDERVAVVVPSGPEELTRLLQATFDVEGFVAFAYFTVPGGKNYFGGERIVVNPDAFEGRSADSTAEVVQHEMVHVATRGRSGPFMPLFVEEGLAELVRFGTGRGPVRGWLPHDHEFTVAASFEAYQLARSAVAHLVREHGIGQVARFYSRLGSVRGERGTSRYHLDRALRRTFGFGVDGFAASWAGTL